MKAMACGVLWLSAAVLGGCASDAPLFAPDMGMMRLALVEDANQAQRLEKALTDPEIANLLDADIKAKLPTPLAVAKVGGYARNLGVETLSADELRGWERCVQGQPQIKGVRAVSSLTMGSDSASLAALRRSAAKMGCELLLVYLEGDSTADNYNDGAALYWTFVGLWLIPGNTYRHLTVMQAVLVDCRTGVVLGTATGEGRLSRSHAAAYTDITRDQLAQEALQKALAEVQKAFALTLRDVVEAADAGQRQAGLVRQASRLSGIGAEQRATGEPATARPTVAVPGTPVVPSGPSFPRN